MSLNLDDLLPEAAKNPTPEPTRNWSPYQSAVFDALGQRSENLLVQAVAGSGKTTTIVEGMKYASANALFLAFNKSIAEELKARIPMGREARTFNSLGHSALYRMLPKGAKLDTWKVTNLIREYTDDQQMVNTIRRLIGLAKHNALGILHPVEPEWFSSYLEEDPDIEQELIPGIAADCCNIFHASNEIQNSFDFDDQVYLPVFHQRKLSSAEVIFVDEAQDLSPIQHLMLASVEGARIVAVGDRAQAIYAFRGADSKSMDTLKQRFSMQELPLSITYRVPERIAMLARSRVPDLEWAKPGGEVIELEQLPAPAAYEKDGIILCRNNRPLFAIALEFLRDRVPCRLMTNMGMELSKFIGKLEGVTSKDALRSLEAWRTEALGKAKNPQRISSIMERYDCVKPFLEEYKLKMQAQHALNSVINSEYGIRICTIHKSKGLEAKNVYFVKPELLNMEEEQEQNLYYVGVTRALEKLHFYREPL